MQLMSILSMVIAQAFLEHWVYNYELPKTMLLDNGN